MSTIVLTPLTAPPTFLSAEERATIESSTPSTFVGIPPILEHSEENIRITFSSETNLAASSPKEWDGTLYLSHAAFSLFDGTSNIGFSLPWNVITLHALDKDAIYCQLTLGNAETQEDDGDDIDFGEMWIHASKESLTKIFDALSMCASVQPAEKNRAEEMFGGFGEGGWIMGDDAVTGFDPDSIEDAEEDITEETEHDGKSGREERKFKPY